MRPNIPIVVAVFVVTCVALLALILTDRMDEHTYATIETTSDTTPSTTWLETQPGLGHRFDEYLAGHARARAAHRVKRKQLASSRPMPGGAPYPTDELLLALARCETGGKMDNPNTGNGYYGYFQYDVATWEEAGQTGVASDYSYEHQRDVTRAFILRVGWGRWPKCSRVIGAR